MHPSGLDFPDRPITLSFEKRHYLDQCDIDRFFGSPHHPVALRSILVHWLLYSIWALICSRSHRPFHPRAAVIQPPTVWEPTPSSYRNCKGHEQQQNSELNASTDFTIDSFPCEICPTTSISSVLDAGCTRPTLDPARWTSNWDWLL